MAAEHVVSLPEKRVRRRARRLVGRALRSRWVPFAVRSRLVWKRGQGSWIARRPASFTGKVCWKMLKDQRPLLTTFADKIAVRDYVRRVVGPEHLTECYATATHADELHERALPHEFVAKVNHGCGGVWIVSDRAPSDLSVYAYLTQPVEVPVDPASGWNWVLSKPQALDWGLLRSTLNAWLAMRYDSYAEWAYRNILPRILVEELLRGPAGEVPSDYKLFVFHGRVRLVQVDVDRFGDHRRNLYTPDWTPVDVEYMYPRAAAECARPPALERMLEVAEALGQETDFVRVDLYQVGTRVVVGELTSYPDAGRVRFAPESFDLELGRWWTLPRRYEARAARHES